MNNPKRLKRVVIKEEFMELLGCPIEAIILNHFIFLSGLRKDFDEFIEEERQRDPDVRIDLTHGWIYKNATELSDEILIQKSDATVRRALRSLAEKGYLDTRSNPKNKWDKTLQYRPDIRLLQQDLMDIGYVLEGYPLYEADKAGKTPNFPNNQNDDSGDQFDVSSEQNECSGTQLDCSDAQNDGAIPEVTTEVTTEETPENFSPVSPQEQEALLAANAASRETGQVDFNLFIEIYNQQRPPNWAECRTLTAKRVRAFKALIKDHGSQTLEVFQSALEFARNDRWCQKNNLGIDNFLSNGKATQWAERNVNRPSNAQERMARRAWEIYQEIGGAA